MKTRYFVFKLLHRCLLRLAMSTITIASQCIMRCSLSALNGTPRCIELSALDRVQPSCHIVFLFLFTNSPKLSTMTDALQATLDCFYPLSGELKQEPGSHVHILNSNMGIEMIIAGSSSSPQEYMSAAREDQLKPARIPEGIAPKTSDRICSIQITQLDAKGLAIALRFDFPSS
jgi:hypothetical protein